MENYSKAKSPANNLSHAIEMHYIFRLNPRLHNGNKKAIFVIVANHIIPHSHMHRRVTIQKQQQKKWSERNRENCILWTELR